MKTEPQLHTDPTLPCLPHMQTQPLPSMGALGLPHKSHSLTGTACFPQPGFCSLFFGDCFSGPGTCCLCPDSRTEKQHPGLGAGLWPADSLTRSVSKPPTPTPQVGGSPGLPHDSAFMFIQVSPHVRNNSGNKSLFYLIHFLVESFLILFHRAYPK